MSKPPPTSGKVSSQVVQGLKELDPKVHHAMVTDVAEFGALSVSAREARLKASGWTKVSDHRWQLADDHAPLGLYGNGQVYTLLDARSGDFDMLTLLQIPQEGGEPDQKAESIRWSDGKTQNELRDIPT